MADLNGSVSFRIVMRLFGNRFYIYIPRWAALYYQRGYEVEIIITPLAGRHRSNEPIRHQHNPSNGRGREYFT